MTKRPCASNCAITISILGLTMAVSSFAQTGPEIKITDGTTANTITIVVDRTNPNNITITTTPATLCPNSVAYPTAPCTSTAAAYSTTTGQLSWQGSVGSFTLTGVVGLSYLTLSPYQPTIDLNIGGALNNSSTSASITAYFGDTGFTDGTSTGAIFSGGLIGAQSGNTAVYSTYFDNGNHLLGIPATTPGATEVGSASAPISATNLGGTGGGSGPTSPLFSMTEEVVFTAPPSQAPGTDFQFQIPSSNIVVTCAATSGQESSPYSSSVSATGGAGGFTYMFTGLPSGLMGNSSGMITGTPNVTFVGTYTVIATDKNGSTETTYCSLNIVQVTKSSPPSLTCPTTVGEVGVPYVGGLSASGGTSPYTFSLVPPSSSSTLDGLILNSNGSISGTPISAETLTFTAKVTDSTAGTAQTFSSSCSIKIQPKLSFSCPTSTGQVGAPYSSMITPVGGIGPYTYSATGLPSWLMLNTSTGALTGTPTSSGSFSINVTVKDSSGATAASSCSNGCTIVIACAFTGTISGYVYDDLNGSKTYNNGDKAFSGVTVTLTSNGKTWTAVSNSSGYYSFTGLVAGSYKVSAPTNAAGNETLDTPSSINVTLSSSSNSCSCASDNNNFGYVGQSTVSGKCYTNDYWGNSHGMGGQCITISGKDCNGNNVNKTCTTDDNGNYSCSGFIPGNYNVSAPSSCNWQNGYHSIQTNSNYNVSCQSNDTHSNINFCYNYGW